MSDKNLRTQLIRLAHAKPELRSALVPLLGTSKKAGTVNILRLSPEDYFTEYARLVAVNALIEAKVPHTKVVANRFGSCSLEFTNGSEPLQVAVRVNPDEGMVYSIMADNPLRTLEEGTLRAESIMRSSPAFLPMAHVRDAIRKALEELPARKPSKKRAKSTL